MRSIMIAAVSVMAFAGMAQAQGPNKPQQQQQRPTAPASQQTHAKPAQPQRPSQPQHSTPATSQQNHTKPGQIIPAPPQHWGKRGKVSWERHVRACQQRYRTYNPRTDRYVARPGQTQLCRL